MLDEQSDSPRHSRNGPEGVATSTQIFTPALDPAVQPSTVLERSCLARALFLIPAGWRLILVGNTLLGTQPRESQEGSQSRKLSLVQRGRALCIETGCDADDEISIGAGNLKAYEAGPAGWPKETNPRRWQSCGAMWKKVCATVQTSLAVSSKRKQEGHYGSGHVGDQGATLMNRFFGKFRIAFFPVLRQEQYPR